MMRGQQAQVPSIDGCPDRRIDSVGAIERRRRHKAREQTSDTRSPQRSGYGEEEDQEEENRYRGPFHRARGTEQGNEKGTAQDVDPHRCRRSAAVENGARDRA